MENLSNNRLNKGLAFTAKERQSLGIHGLLPPAVSSQEDQKQLVLTNLARLATDLDRYVFLMHLLDRNERLFYNVLSTGVESIMPLVYTPTVGEACTKYGMIFTQPKGMFISINDRGHVGEVLANWPVQDVKVIVVTDGERILGLGDLGAQGMGIPVGKLALYTALAGVNPAQCLPITLDTGTNNATFLEDPNYIGLRHKRVRGEVYDEFIEEFITAVQARFGTTCLIQFEDFANANAFRLLKKYQPRACTFNDDIQGTASVALAGLLAAVRVTGRPVKDSRFMFYGAGEAAIGTAELIALAIHTESKQAISLEEARANIFLVDSRGLIVQDRPEGGINHEKAPFAKKGISPMKDLLEIVKFVKPNALIGCAAQGKKFTEEIVQVMCEINERPIVFALSNPTHKAECTAEEAYSFSKGKAIFASGSPFEPVEYKGKTFHPGQGNNCYIFPGVGLACVAFDIRHITDEFFLVSAESLASKVTQQEIEEGRVYPNLNRIQEVSSQIALDVGKYAQEKGLINLYPAPQSEAELKAQLTRVAYSTEYVNPLKSSWEHDKLPEQLAASKI